MSKAKAKEKVIGRPPTITPILKTHSLLFISKTSHELVDILFPKVQDKMRGGVTDDPIRIKAQKVSLYQSIIRFRKAAAEGNKKIAFRGRKGEDGIVRTRWIHRKPEKVSA